MKDESGKWQVASFFILHPSYFILCFHPPISLITLFSGTTL